MMLGLLKRALRVCAFLFLPALAYAQDATFAGAVTDSTGGVSPRRHADRRS